MIYDLLALASFAAVSAGLWLVDPRLALVVGGTILLAAACCGSVNARRDRARKESETRRRRGERNFR